MENLWGSLECECGSRRFIQAIELRWKLGGGIVPTLSGKYLCTLCHVSVDGSSLIDRAKDKLKQQRMKELESELGR